MALQFGYCISARTYWSPHLPHSVTITFFSPSQKIEINFTLSGFLIRHDFGFSKLPILLSIFRTIDARRLLKVTGFFFSLHGIRSVGL